MRSDAAFHLKGRLRMAPKVPICATICLTLFLSLPGFLQALPLASVRGRITDPQGSPVSGVKLILTASGGLAAGATTSDSHGNFIFNNIAFGTYRLTAEAPGFISIQRVLEVTDPAVNVSLQFQKLSSTEQRVTVRASVPPVLAPDPSARTIEPWMPIPAAPGRRSRFPACRSKRPPAASKRRSILRRESPVIMENRLRSTFKLETSFIPIIFPPTRMATAILIRTF